MLGDGPHIQTRLSNCELPPNLRHWPDGASVRTELQVLSALQDELNRLEPLVAAQAHIDPDASDEEGSAQSAHTADLFGSDFAESTGESD